MPKAQGLCNYIGDFCVLYKLFHHLDLKSATVRCMSSQFINLNHCLRLDCREAGSEAILMHAETWTCRQLLLECPNVKGLAWHVWFINENIVKHYKTAWKIIKRHNISVSSCSEKFELDLWNVTPYNLCPPLEDFESLVSEPHHVQNFAPLMCEVVANNFEKGTHCHHEDVAHCLIYLYTSSLHAV